MKRPSMYNRHEANLKAFVEKFNNVKDDLRLVMQIYNTENFRDDGVIVDTKTGKRITFDWEIRDRYFTSGKFVFKELGQFERKLRKGEIGLSLQCDQSFYEFSLCLIQIFQDISISFRHHFSPDFQCRS